ncbi:MAG: hypothetical protein GYA30_12225, partial [Chloroflexi bacterium]|nr:hypothetical protein [Chloroflexota bacterium]
LGLRVGVEALGVPERVVGVEGEDIEAGHRCLPQGVEAALARGGRKSPR